MRIIFMGTPDFAVASLAALVEANSNVVAVITAPDKPSGRGLRLAASPVKVYAMAQNIPVLQPEKLKNADFLAELRSYQADLQVVVAFRMLPEVVWNMPRLGTFNLHASLLPQYRGAAPINWAIMNGEVETGVTTFFLEQEIDTGNIIFQEKEPITYHDNIGTLYARLMHKGAGLVVRTVASIAANNYPQIPQSQLDDTKAAPKIFKENCEINWDAPAEVVRNFVRGLSPYPAAWTVLNQKTCKIFEVEVSSEPLTNQAAGTVETDNKTYLSIATQDAFLMVKELQLEGKKRMTVEDFLRGTKINA